MLVNAALKNDVEIGKYAKGIWNKTKAETETSLKNHVNGLLTVWKLLDEARVGWPIFFVTDLRAVPVLKIEDFNVIEMVTAQERTQMQVELLKGQVVQLSEQVTQLTALLCEKLTDSSRSVVEIREKGVCSNLVYQNSVEYSEEGGRPTYSAVVKSSLKDLAHRSFSDESATKLEDVVNFKTTPKHKKKLASKAPVGKILPYKGERYFSFRVGGLNRSTTADLLKEHIESEMGFLPLNVQELQKAEKNIPTNHTFSFKSFLVVSPVEEEGE